MAKYKVGDWVFIPNAYEFHWESYMSKIELIEETENGTVYLIRTLRRNCMSFNGPDIKDLYPFKEHEIFTDRKACNKYISNYYYNGLCRGCKYEDGGTVWTCGDCSYRERWSKCLKAAGICVGNESEICKFYSPTLPQNIKSYVSWEHYEDELRNCEFNPDCDCHKYSCHKTCTYEHYMNELMDVSVDFMYEGRKVKFIKIPRKYYLDQSFIKGNQILCKCLIFKPLLTPTGMKKKNAVNFKTFDDLTWVEMKKETEEEK